MSLYLIDECKQNPDDDKKPSAEVVDETKQQPSTTVEVEPTSKEVVNESTEPNTVDTIDAIVPITPVKGIK